MTASLYTFERLLSVSSHDEIFQFLGRQCDQLGYTSYFYSPLLGSQGEERLPEDDGHAVEVGNLVNHDTYTTFPAAWVHRYQEAGHVNIDPVLRQVAACNLPVFWDDVRRRMKKHIVFDEARQHGLANGIAVPVCGMKGDRALLSIATDMPAEKSAGHRAATAGQALLTVLHVHEAVQRLGDKLAMATAPRLTRREKECLSWAAQGKTSWEISNILGVAERTVIFHIANATRKLNATNRRQAVVRAISLRLIQP